MILFFVNQQGATGLQYGAASLELTAGFVSQSRPTGGQVSLGLGFNIRTTWQGDTPAELYPEVQYEIAFSSQPLAATPSWVELHDRARGYTTQRGRSFEFERMETGTYSALLSNLDSALSPDNSSSPYAPVRSTRPVRARVLWDRVYPLFRGISEGFPQSYPHLGFDAVVQLQANDLFYALNNSRFVPGSTTLTSALEGGVDPNTEVVISVSSTALPMPQAVPFTISVAGITSDWPQETMDVLEIIDQHSYLVTRTASQEESYQHPSGATISTEHVSFAEAYSGERIRQVLEAVGFDSSWYDLELGQSLISPSEDLASVAPLEHINLVAEAEFGRFFVSREGKFTFRDRHSGYVDHLSPDITFAVDSVPFVLEGALEHTDEKLYNRAKITIQGGAYDGQVVDMSDEASIAEHFERVYERVFPYANLNDAESAVRYVLSHSAETQVRVPGITVFGARNPAVFWPLILDREIGDRARFRYTPEGGGDEIDRQLTIDGIVHSIAPESHSVTFRCTEISPLDYWILGKAGYSELGSTTLLAF